MLEFTAFIDVFALWAKSFVLLFGVFIIVRDIFVKPQIFEIKYKKIIMWFLASGCITAFMNMSPNFLLNLVFVFHSVVCFFIFFGIEKNTDKKIILKEIDF
ncbi:MAG: hypothetical protein LBJ32_03975, partial [Oscillospiraceae bacterium]|nr:hypothetical protein [Oscillospiraceae bacterium]